MLQAVAPGIWMMSAPLPGAGSVHLYVVRGELLALIDTGYDEHIASTIAPALDEIGLRIEDVDLVLNTHGHPDHLGGNGGVAGRSGAQIAIHAADAPLTSGIDAHMRSSTDVATVLSALGCDAAVAERQAYLLPRLGRPAAPSLLLKHGDRIDLGRGVIVEVIHVPGHTDGSVAFMLAGRGIVFSGDAVQLLGGVPGLTPLYFDPDGYRQSLLKLRQIAFTTLCMGHGFLGSRGASDRAPVRVGAEAIGQALDDSVAFIDRMEEAAATALAVSGNRDPLALTCAALDALGDGYASPPAAPAPPAINLATAWAHVQRATSSRC